ncbi:MAG: DciA family protein [Myxococcota bacterium]
MSARPKRDPSRVRGMVTRVLADLGHTGAGPAFRLFDAWEKALGDAAEHAEPVDLRAGVLDVAVDSSVWAQQLQMRSSEILASLVSELGEEAPTELRFRLRGRVR